MKKVPTSTYRLQMTPFFTFLNLKEIISYLDELGISHIYASPVFESREGSTSGYDLVDPNSFNQEFGSRKEFMEILEELEEREMGWIQDFPPNHMAYDYENRMLRSVLENGTTSPYFEFFDMDWDHPAEELNGKLLAPFLGVLTENHWRMGRLSLPTAEAVLPSITIA